MIKKNMFMKMTKGTGAKMQDDNEEKELMLMRAGRVLDFVKTDAKDRINNEMVL